MRDDSHPARARARDRSRRRAAGRPCSGACGENASSTSGPASAARASTATLRARPPRPAHRLRRPQRPRSRRSRAARPRHRHGTDAPRIGGIDERRDTRAQALGGAQRAPSRRALAAEVPRAPGVRRDPGPEREAVAESRVGRVLDVRVQVHEARREHAARQIDAAGSGCAATQLGRRPDRCDHAPPPPAPRRRRAEARRPARPSRPRRACSCLAGGRLRGAPPRRGRGCARRRARPRSRLRRGARMGTSSSSIETGSVPGKRGGDDGQDDDRDAPVLAHHPRREHVQRA